MKIRVVTTASKAKAVQAVRYQNNRRIIVKHFGSCHTGEELDQILQIAREWVKDFAGQLSIFPDDNPNALLHINHSSFLGVHYTFFYDLKSFVQKDIGFDHLRDPLLKDLVTMRLFEPASKLRSIELLENYFGIVHQRKSYYKLAHKWLALKEAIEERVVDFARRKYSFNFDLLFYDVTGALL